MNDPAVAAQEAVYAGLDAALWVVPLDLCAYLHLPVASGPQLFLRRPDLSSLDASTAFTLFTSLREAVDRESPAVPGYHAIFVPTFGRSSRGLHAVGRRESPLGDDERATVEALCRATAAAAHALEPEQASAEPLRVAVEIQGDVIRGEVEVVANGERYTGKAERAAAHEAVAAAALVAIGATAELDAARAVDIAGERAALVLVHTPDGRGVGSALTEPGGDPLTSFAHAALRAADAAR